MRLPEKCCAFGVVEGERESALRHAEIDHRDDDGSLQIRAAFIQRIRGVLVGRRDWRPAHGNRRRKETGVCCNASPYVELLPALKPEIILGR